MNQPSIRLLSPLLLLLSVLLPVMLTAEAGAQEARGARTAELSGIVRSQAGLPLAEVEVRFDPGGVQTRTDDDGRFTLSVPAGAPGVLRFAAAGFAAEEVEIAALAPDARRSVSVTLSALYTLDALSVVTPRERPLLNTEDASTGGTIERLALQALPTDARDPLTLAFTVPGVAQANSFFGDAPPLTINGTNALYTQYMVDGLDNNEGFLGGPRVAIPLAAIDRLSVLANTYSVAFGRSPNGVVNIETRAGGNQWAGEAFIFNRPGIPLDASPKFAPAGVDPEGFRRTQVGGAVGGPLVRDRTFLFTTAEYTTEREDRIGSTARTQFLGTEQRETLKFFGRLDHGWTPAQTTTLRFAASGVTRAGQGGGVIVPEADITTRRIGTLTNLTHRSALRGGAASNELSLQAGTFRWNFPPTESDFNTPRVTILSADLQNVEAVVGSSNFVFDEKELQFQLRNVFETRFGENHTLRMGADVIRSAFQLEGASTNPMGSYTVVNEGNITASGRFVSIDDIPDDVRVVSYTIDANPQRVDLNQTVYGAFIEDRWRVSPSLTLQAGLRWDYDDITSRGQSAPDLNNFQPRLSANWYATPHSVVRAGFGLYTGKFPYAVYSDAVQFGEDGNAPVTFQGETFPPPAFGEGRTAGDFGELRDDLPPREIRRMFARGLEQPTSTQVTLGYQWQFDEVWALSVDGVYVGTRNLPRSWDLNPIGRELTPADSVNRPVEFGDPFRPVRPVPGSFRRLTTTDSGGRGRYLGLYTVVRRQLSDQLLAQLRWVWSRAQNDTEDINFHAAQGNDFDAEWADAVNDRRHQLSMRGVYKPWPQLRLSGIADYQTGTPINRIAGFGVDLDGSGFIYGEGFIGNYDRHFGVPRNGERLPDRFQLSLSAAYLAPVFGNRLELRADVFNVLNTTVVSGFANGIPGGGPRTQVGRPGDPVEFSQAGPPRQIQLSARYVF